jgi:hypothetical protein
MYIVRTLVNFFAISFLMALVATLLFANFATQMLVCAAPFLVWGVIAAGILKLCGVF